MNQRLKGYTVQLPGLHFQLIGLSVTLKNLRVLQQAHPDPPVALFPKIHASVHWRELLSGHLVADFLFDNPRVFVNLKQLRALQPFQPGPGRGALEGKVATVASLSGRVDSPQSNTWQVIARLIENAFFRAILPGFDREISPKRP